MILVEFQDITKSSMHAIAVHESNYMHIKPGFVRCYAKNILNINTIAMSPKLKPFWSKLALTWIKWTPAQKE